MNGILGGVLAPRRRDDRELPHGSGPDLLLVRALALPLLCDEGQPGRARAREQARLQARAPRRPGQRPGQLRCRGRSPWKDIRSPWPFGKPVGLPPSGRRRYEALSDLRGERRRGRGPARARILPDARPDAVSAPHGARGPATRPLTSVRAAPSPTGTPRARSFAQRAMVRRTRGLRRGGSSIRTLPRTPEHEAANPKYATGFHG